MKNTQKISISTFVLIPALLSAQSILIDFGDESTQTTGLADTWNNAHLGIVAGGDTGTLFADMVDTTNTATGISLSITDAFDGRNANGTTSGSAPYATDATRDSFYTARNESFNGYPNSNDQGILLFSGLDPNKTYDFTMFASRSATDNRNTDYILNFGETNATTVTLNAASNVSNTVTASSIAPTALGEITLTVTPGSGNNSGYSYLGVVEIAVIPEPGTFALLLGAMATGLVMLRRRS